MRKANSTLTEQVYDTIYEDIVNQKLICGEKLTLKGLAQRYEVSYTPIREALSRLAEAGLVTYYSNCGVKVIDFSDADIQDLFQFVGELDAMAIKLSQRAAVQDAMLYELREVVTGSNQLLASGKVKEWKTYSQDFHKIFYKYAQSVCLNDAAVRLRGKVELLSIMYYKDVDLTKINKDHNDILQKVEEGDFSGAADLMRAHLQYDMLFAIKAFEHYRESRKG